MASGGASGWKAANPDPAQRDYLSAKTGGSLPRSRSFSSRGEATRTLEGCARGEEVLLHQPAARAGGHEFFDREDHGFNGGFLLHHGENQGAAGKSHAEGIPRLAAGFSSFRMLFRIQNKLYGRGGSATAKAPERDSDGLPDIGPSSAGFGAFHDRKRVIIFASRHLGVQS